MTVGLGKREFYAIFINGSMKVCMVAGKDRSHIDFEVCRNANLVAKAAERVSSIGIILCRLRVDRSKISIGKDEGAGMSLDGMVFRFNMVQRPFTTKVMGVEVEVIDAIPSQ